jgi:hypothetical protein
MADLQLKTTRAGAKPPPPRAIIEAEVVSRTLSQPPDESIERLELKNRLKVRSDICEFLIKSLGFSTVCCFGLIILQGFHPFGFQMDAALLKWLCGTTIAQSGVLLTVFTNAVWQRTSRNPNRISRNSP